MYLYACLSISLQVYQSLCLFCRLVYLSVSVLGLSVFLCSCRLVKRGHWSAGAICGQDKRCADCSSGGRLLRHSTGHQRWKSQHLDLQVRKLNVLSEWKIQVLKLNILSEWKEIQVLKLFVLSELKEIQVLKVNVLSGWKEVQVLKVNVLSEWKEYRYSRLMFWVERNTGTQAKCSVSWKNYRYSSVMFCLSWTKYRYSS